MTDWFEQMAKEFEEYADFLRKGSDLGAEGEAIAINIENRVEKIRRARNNDRAKEKMDVEPNF